MIVMTKMGGIRALSNLSELSASPPQRDTDGVRSACNTHAGQQAISVQEQPAMPMILNEIQGEGEAHLLPRSPSPGQR